MPELRQSIAQHYHERTKYDPETISAKHKGLDWAKQPVPFKEYKIGSTFDLKPYIKEKPGSFTNNLEAQWWQRLSRLLFCSYGLTARMPSMGSTVYLRAAPSAGGLYPAEMYLISRGTSFLPAGLYNSQLAIVLTSVFYRSAWRYEDRAYRRICLDTGHLLGNIELAGALTGYRAHLIGGFVDEDVNELLYIDSKQEGAIAVVGLADLQDIQQQSHVARTALPSATETDFPRIPDGELLDYFHRATQIQPGTTGNLNLPEVKQDKSIEDKYNFSFCDKISTATKPVYWGKKLEGLEETILKRRSTRAFSGEALQESELKALLDFTYQPQNYRDQNFDSSPDYFDLNLIETFIAVSGVEGLERGCYYYAPSSQELRQIRFKNFRRELHFLCLGQDLGRDASAVVFHTADLKNAVAQYGDRVYRYLHMDAGHLGQRLNLGAIRLGLGVSGIGGFFDDKVNEVLGIPDKEAVLYITTLGKPR